MSIAKNVVAVNMQKSRKPHTYHHGDLRNALIRTSLEILRNEGANALTLRAVARRANVSHAAPYRHFESKEALLAAIAEEGFRELTTRLSAARERSSTNPRGLFEEIAWAYVKFAQDNPDHLRVMFSDLITDWDAYPALRAAGLEAFQLLVDMVRDGQAAGFVRQGSAQHMAVAGWSTVHGLALLLIAKQVRLTIGETDAETLARTCARFYVEGIARK